MVAVTLTNLASLANQTSAISTINNNSAAITTGFTDCLSINDTSSNTLGVAINMNSNSLYNLPFPASNTEPVRLEDFATLLGNSIGVNESLTFASPTNKVGLTASSGSAVTTLHSDVTLSLDQSIAPTWTGAHTFSNATASSSSSTGAVVLTAGGLGVAGNLNIGGSFIQSNNLNGTAELALTNSNSGGSTIAQFIASNSNSAGQTAVLGVVGGSGSTGYLNFGPGNSAATIGINSVAQQTFTKGGGIQIGSPTGGDKGAGTINAQNLYINGSAVTSPTVTVNAGTSNQLAYYSGTDTVSGNSNITTNSTGDIIIAGSLKSGTFVRTTSDQTVTSSVTPVNTALSISGLEAGVAYMVEIFYYATGGSGGLYVDFGGGSATMTSTVIGTGEGGVATSLTSDVCGLASLSSATFLQAGTLVVNAGGSLTVRFSQHSSNATGTVFKAGSWLRLMQVA